MIDPGETTLASATALPVASPLATSVDSPIPAVGATSTDPSPAVPVSYSIYQRKDTLSKEQLLQMNKDLQARNVNQKKQITRLSDKTAFLMKEFHDIQDSDMDASERVDNTLDLEGVLSMENLDERLTDMCTLLLTHEEGVTPASVGYYAQLSALIASFKEKIEVTVKQLKGKGISKNAMCIRSSFVFNVLLQK